MRTKYILTLEHYPRFCFDIVAALVKTYCRGNSSQTWKALAETVAVSRADDYNVLPVALFIEDKDTIDHIFGEVDALLSSIYVPGKKNRFLACARWGVGHDKPIIYVEHVLDG